MTKKDVIPQWPIPTDWNLSGGRWIGYCISWPDSFEWHVVIRSLIYLLTRGRLWDAQSGSILTTQAIAWEVFNRNSPFVLCAESEYCPECPPETQNGVPGGLYMEDDAMPCIDISNLLKIEDGTLYARDACCEWISIGRIAGLNQSVGDDPTNPTGDPNFVYSACGKAAAIVSIVYKIIEASFDVVSDPLVLPWQILGKIEQAVGYNLDNLWLSMLAVNAAAAWALSVTYDDIASDVEKQRIICQLEPMFADDALGVTSSAMFEEIKGIFRSNIGVTNWGWYDQAINALGTNDMNTVAKLGASDTVTNCDCPSEVAVPFAGIGLDRDWRVVYDFRDLQWGFGLGVNTHWTAGLGLWADNEITDHKAPISAYKLLTNVDNGSTLELVGLRWKNIGDEGYLTAGTRIGTEEVTVIGLDQIVALCGNSPATAGEFETVISANDPLGADETEWRAELQASHATDVSQVLIAIMFAGSGPGPV